MLSSMAKFIFMFILNISWLEKLFSKLYNKGVLLGFIFVLVVCNIVIVGFVKVVFRFNKKVNSRINGKVEFFGSIVFSILFRGISLICSFFMKNIRLIIIINMFVVIIEEYIIGKFRIIIWKNNR